MNVRALKRVRQNGRYYEPGTEWDMPDGMVPAHVATGQVEVVDDPSTASQPPADKAMKKSRKTK